MQHYQPSTKQIMALMAERDVAIQDRNLALSEKKIMMAERDLAFLQRDTAIKERNDAIMERDNVLENLHFQENPINVHRKSHNQIQCPIGCQVSRKLKHTHHSLQHVDNENRQHNQSPYNSRDLHIIEAIPLSSLVTSGIAKSNGNKHMKESEPISTDKKAQKNPKKQKRESDASNKLIFGKSHEWTDEHDVGSMSDDFGKPIVYSKSDWKDQDLELNLIIYDDTIMPPPVCSCTGVVRQCYKWGNGGWQSSCCTTSISQYPLPSVPNKRHARVGGRKMSGGAYNKLLSKLASEGYDLSKPVDLKDKWAKHGTNRYITIK